MDHNKVIKVGPNDKIFALTGAGISSESGIPTFRDVAGLWEQHAIEDVASPQGFRKDPSLVWKFYAERRRGAIRCRPNAAHIALANVASLLGDRFFLCTQNVDSLHEVAGSVVGTHMHGRLFYTRCSECDAPPFYDESMPANKEEIPRCNHCGALCRPDIVWFGEMIMDYDVISKNLEDCTIFLAVGTSGSVYPAASYAEICASRGVRTIYVGPEEPKNSRHFTDIILGTATAALPDLFSVHL